jgi:hypothetical protein
MERKYVKVKVLIDENGNVTPEVIFFNDKPYNIDRVLEVAQRPFRTGGNGLRYMVRIKGRERYLGLIDNRWFVEIG